MPEELPAAAAWSSASDVFLHVQTKRAGKIRGESTSPAHQDEILVVSWNWGLSAGSAIGSGQATARRAYKHLTVVKTIDSASTPLMSALASNDEVKEARLSMCKSGDHQLDFFTIVLGGARVVSIELSVDENGTALERVAFAFTQVEVEYRGQDAHGQLAAASTFMDEVLPQ